MHSHYKNNRTYFFVCTIIIFTLAIISSAAMATEEKIQVVWLTTETMTTIEKGSKKIEKSISN